MLHGLRIPVPHPQSKYKFFLTVGLQAQADYEQHDAREGDNVTLKCRFAITAKGRESPVHYWAKSTANTHDNVAINDSPLGPNYK